MHIDLYDTINHCFNLFNDAVKKKYNVNSSLNNISKLKCIKKNIIVHENYIKYIENGKICKKFISLNNQKLSKEEIEFLKNLGLNFNIPLNLDEV